ncbi:hypothetical protein BT69DRAFT_1275548 [Atractiella rhizophila]|nr:hypothetical protein BT69DRAFT_1275548 [Atractiella rhizophila]
MDREVVEPACEGGEWVVEATVIALAVVEVTAIVLTLVEGSEKLVLDSDHAEVEEGE